MGKNGQSVLLRGRYITTTNNPSTSPTQSTKQNKINNQCKREVKNTKEKNEMSKAIFEGCSAEDMREDIRLCLKEEYPKWSEQKIVDEGNVYIAQNAPWDSAVWFWKEGSLVRHKLATAEGDIMAQEKKRVLSEEEKMDIRLNKTMKVINGGSNGAYKRTSALKSAEDWYNGSFMDIEKDLGENMEEKLAEKREEMYDRWGYEGTKS